MEGLEIVEKKYSEAVSGLQNDWFTTVDSNWYNYVVELSADLQITYLVVVLDNQIFNGGLHQYFVNGYGQFAKETIRALKEIGALKKSDILNEALKIVNVDGHFDAIFRSKLLKGEIEQLFHSDDLFEPLDKLDALYDEDGKDIVLLLANYLSNNRDR